MKAPKKLILEANQEMTILEALKAYPESKAFVFQVDLGTGRGNNDYYMKLGDPVFTPDDTKYVSVFNAMGFNKHRGELWFGEFFVPRGRELKSITNLEFLRMLEETADRIRKAPHLFPIHTLGNFKEIGLYE